MLVSLEIPVPEIEAFLPLTDFPFGLAHMCYESHNKYFREYISLMSGCLMDNGMYENNDEPMAIPDILRAALRCNAVSVIAPDWMDDKDCTLNATLAMLEAVRAIANVQMRVGSTVQGEDLEERVDAFKLLQAAGCRPICFPFRTPRAETIEALNEQGCFVSTGWYHLFGLENLEELTMSYPGVWSIDTGKPFKGIDFRHDKLRGHGKLDLQKPLEPRDSFRAAYNIALMRKIITAGEI